MTSFIYRKFLFDFYPPDLVKLILKQLFLSGSVNSTRYIPRRFASQYISTTIHLPFKESCIIAFIYQAKMQGSSRSCTDLTLYWTSNLEQAAVYLYYLSILKRVIKLCIQDMDNELIVCKWSHFVCFMLLAAHQDILSEIPLTVRRKGKLFIEPKHYI